MSELRETENNRAVLLLAVLATVFASYSRLSLPAGEPAALPHRLGDMLTIDLPWDVLLSTLVPALALGLVLLVVHAALREVGVTRGRALPLVAGLGVLPIVYAPGATPDLVLMLFCALATLQLVRFVRRQIIADAYWCALWLTLAGSVAFSVWAFVAVSVAVLLYELRAPLGAWLLHAAGITALALALPVWWLVRNGLPAAELFSRVASGALPAPVYDRSETSFVNMLAETPVLNWLFALVHDPFTVAAVCRLIASPEHCSALASVGLSGVGRNSVTLVVALLAIVFTLYLLRLVWQGLRRAEPPDPTYCLGGPPRSLAEAVGDWLGGSRVRWLWVLLMLFAGLAAAVMLVNVSAIDHASHLELILWQGWLAWHGDGLLLAGALLVLAYLLSVLLRRRSVPGGQPIAPSQRMRADLRWIADLLVQPGVAPPRAGLRLLVLTLLGGLAVAVLIQRLFGEQTLGDVQVLVVSTAPLAVLLAVALLLLPQTAIDRVALYGPIMLAVVVGVLLGDVYRGYLLAGVPPGVEGVALAPVFPMLLIALGIALQRLRMPVWVCLGLLVVLALAFADTMIVSVLPLLHGSGS